MRIWGQFGCINPATGCIHDRGIIVPLSNEERLSRLEYDVASTKRDLAAIKKNTQELIDLFQNAKTGIEFFKGFLSFCKYIGTIVIFVWALLYALKLGNITAPPPKL